MEKKVKAFSIRRWTPPPIPHLMNLFFISHFEKYSKNTFWAGETPHPP